MSTVGFLLVGDDDTVARLRRSVDPLVARRPGRFTVSEIGSEASWSHRVEPLVSGAGPAHVLCRLDRGSVDLVPEVLERGCDELEGSPSAQVVWTAGLEAFPDLAVEALLIRGDAPSASRDTFVRDPRSLTGTPARDGMCRRALTEEERALVVGGWFERTRFFPSAIFIEVSSACNLRCPMCPCHGNGRAQDIPGAFMDLGLYRRIIDEAAAHDVPRGRITVNPQLRGESTLHPRFPEMLRMAHERGLRVTLSTNAVLLGPEVVDALARWADHVFLSLDSVRPETYRRIRGADLASVLEGVDRLLEARRRLRGTSPQVFAAFVQVPDNRGELEAFMSHWRGRVDGVLVYQERVLPGWYREPVAGEEGGEVPRERIPCSHVVGSCAILADGTLTPCCFSTDAIEPLGRLTPDGSLEALYNGPEYRRFRALHAAHRFAESPLCAGCNAWGLYRPAPSPRPGWHLLQNAYSRFYLA